MRAAILAVLLVACSEHGESGPHTIVECGAAPSGQCELACASDVEDGLGEPTCGIMRASGSIAQCGPIVEFDGLMGCCHQLLEDEGVVRFHECVE